MKILLSGPWLGEFGWELMRWQAKLRKLVHDEKFDRVIISCQPGHEFLYQDFATKFISNAIGKSSDGWRSSRRNPNFGPGIVEKLRSNYKPESEFVIITPTRKTTLFENQEFIKYKPTSDEPSYDLVFHARNINKNSTRKRNWRAHRWYEVSQYFKKQYKMASIGFRDRALHIADTDDCRNLDIQQLVNLICNSKLIIGPSSGPMHLASLCGITHLIWTGKEYWGSIKGTNRERYVTKWNPFNTKVVVLDNCNWQPQVSDVIRTIKETMLL